MNRKISIGIAGLGNIGQGVARIIESNRDKILKKTGIELDIRSVCIKDMQKKRTLPTDAYLMTDDYNRLVDDPQIDIVVELIGGVDAARDLIQKALKAGKHVVTANKAVMAKHGEEFFRLAEINKVKINYEAAVAGSIPVIRSFDVSFISDRIISIIGIINGTTNFILTRMSREGLDYKDALKQAQKLGFAEADPSLDVGGDDAAQKLAVLSRIAFNTDVSLDDIYYEGITGIRPVDISYACEMGYEIKLLAIARQEKGRLEMRVHPALIPKSHILASIRDEINAVLVTGENIGEQLFYGKGAGQLPTASTVVADIIDVARRGEMFYEYDRYEIQSIDDLKTEYYLRFDVDEMPGILMQITTVLTKHNISVMSLIQKQTDSHVLPVIITVHKTDEKNMQDAFKEISSFDFVRSSNLMRVL
ncbi:homoserine dehydrogenase [Candidatus Woesearchaeota archaeon]|nr:homoserine dehydrogenase [Candidatus Woesearchaeota archaeon]